MKSMIVRATCAAMAALCLMGCSRDLYGSSAAAEAAASQAAQVEAVDVASEPEEEPLLSESTAELLRAGVYYLDCASIIKMEDLRLENAMTIAVRGADSSIKTTSEMSGALTTMRILTLDGATWLVNETTKSYQKVDPTEMQGGFNTDYSMLLFEEHGEGDFDGARLRYEQYDQKGDVVRFFFDENDRLCGLTRSLDEEQLPEMTLRIKAISGNIPPKTIALPDGYTKQ